MTIYPLELGQKVWIVDNGNKEVGTTCEDCCGKCFVTVITGDDQKFTIPCEGCKHGYSGPTGKVYHWERYPEVRQGEIIAQEINKEGARYAVCNGLTNYYIDHDDICLTESDAMDLAKQKAKEATEENVKRLQCKFKQHKSWAWHVSYYRKQIKRAEEEIARSKKYLEYAKTVAKTDDKENAA